MYVNEILHNLFGLTGSTEISVRRTVNGNHKEGSVASPLQVDRLVS